MTMRVDRLRIEMSRLAHARLGIRDTLAFVEDGDFLREFTENGLDDEDLQNIQTVITVCPTRGEVVPVSKHVRDIIYYTDADDSVVIRYAYLRPSTVLLLMAYSGNESLHMTLEEAEEADAYIEHQINIFSKRCTR